MGIGTIALTVMMALGQAGWPEKKPIQVSSVKIGWSTSLEMAEATWQKRTEAQCRLVWTDRSGKQWRGRVTSCEEAWKHYRAMLEKRRDARVHVETVRGRKR